MYGVTLKKAYKTAFDFIMPTLGVTKNIPALIYNKVEPQDSASNFLIYSLTHPH